MARHPALWNSPWPAEDGGPRRLLAVRGPGPGLRAGERLAATSRPATMANMVVLRAPGEVYLQGSSPPGPDSTAWLERLDPETLAPLARSPDLPGGPWWPGGVLAHANGALYLTHGRHCHKLDRDCRVLASRTLPRDDPYNSLVPLGDGHLVMKNFVRDGRRSHLVVLEPDGLVPIGPEVEVPEGSIARLSATRSPAGDLVYVVGDHTAFRFRWTGAQLLRDPTWEVRYRTAPDDEQSWGWGPVLTGEHIWFMDNGDGEFQGSLHGGGKARGPLHLVRIATTDARDHELFVPFGLPHGTIVNPPLVDPDRRIVVAYDSGNGRIAAFRFDGPGRFARLWEHAFDTSNHFLRWPDSGEIAVNDYRDGQEHAVVLDLDTGTERGRVAIGSPIQSVVFQSPGFARDFYTCTFTTVARVTPRSTMSRAGSA